MLRNPIIIEDLQAILSADLPFESLDGATVLITGANGFLPAYLVETLLHRNDQYRDAQIRVLALVRNFHKAERRFAHHRGRTDLQFLVQDVSAPLAVEGPVDVIIHAASPASPQQYTRNPVDTIAANVTGTGRLLELARFKGTKGFLYLSSAEVYGSAPMPCSETIFGALDPLAVRSCYAESKRMGETLCAAWHRQWGVPAKIVRPFHTYGPGLALDDGRIFADLVADIVRRRDLRLHGDGRAIRAFCYLSDATIGFWTVLLKGDAGQAYNVGNPDGEVSMLELAQRLARLFPERGLEVHRTPPRDDQSADRAPPSRCVPDVSRLQALGWRPVHHIESGFARTIRSVEWEQAPVPGSRVA